MTCLMLISCSGAKRSDPGELPAVERYQGTTYKVINKARREGYWPNTIDLFILSAKYGLISERTPIKLYDLKMSEKRAIELRDEVSSALDALLRAKPYEAIFVNIWQTYMHCISASVEYPQASKNGRLQEASGGIGLRLKQTKDWIIFQNRNR